MTENFNISQYFENLDKQIYSILSRPSKDTLTYDILDTEKSIDNKKIALKERQRLMKIGEIWQEALGTYNEFRNLKNRHPSGLDIISEERKIAIELKNRTNTDNSKSKKSNLDNLSYFKEEHPEYTCIYANINDNTKEKTMLGKNNIIIHNGVEIYHQVGMEFLKFILKDDVDIIIEFIKNTIDIYQ
jgi:hypothetical protein